jgi:hypothetical protein
MSIKTVITGYALLLAQSYVVTNPFFGETEIRKFIALRERFHPEFTQACLQLAQNIENGDYGHGLETAVPILRSVSQITRKDVHRAILAVTRAFRNLFASNLPPEMPGDIRNMVYLAKVCMHADQYGHEHKYLFEKVIQSNPEPTQIKTFLRQIIKLPVLATMTPLEEANPGAWFDMTPEKRVAIRSRMTQLDKELKNAFDQIQASGRVKLFKSHRAGIADGEQKRDFIFVEDVVETLIFAWKAGLRRGIYNLGTGQARSFRDLVVAVFETLKKPIQIDFIDTPLELRERYQYFTQAEMSKLRSVGYARPFTSLEEGVRRTVERLKKGSS